VYNTSLVVKDNVVTLPTCLDKAVFVKFKFSD
jgi:hypothetical protein